MESAKGRQRNGLESMWEGHRIPMALLSCRCRSHQLWGVNDRWRVCPQDVRRVIMTPAAPTIALGIWSRSEARFWRTTWPQ
jgi:hypothetical protein